MSWVDGTHVNPQLTLHYNKRMKTYQWGTTGKKDEVSLLCTGQRAQL